jgi:Protein of unknown function (DUF2510)
MILIFGFRRRVALLATLSLACPNGHVAAHRILKLTRWFTLFFLPVIPVSRKYLSVCIQCGVTLDIPKSAAEEMASAVSTGTGPTPDPTAPPLPLPATMVDSGMPPAGWYPDPSGSQTQRYWDGHAWTAEVEHP